MKRMNTVRQRVLLALVANCRAGGVRLESMIRLSSQIGVSQDRQRIEVDLLEWARQIQGASTLNSILNWCNLVRGSSIPLTPPQTLQARQLKLAA